VPRLARWITLSYLVFLTLFVAALGTGLGNLCFGLMMCIHSLGVLFLFEQVSGAMVLFKRVLYSLLLLTVISQFCYLPFRGWITSRVALPLHTQSGVVVIRPTTTLGTVQRGDWVAYRLGAHRLENLIIRGGYGFDRVIGVAGDEIRFEPGRLLVNGRVTGSAADMPSSGTLVVRVGHYYIWSAMEQNWVHAAQDTVTAAKAGLAHVEAGALVGRPYKRWFWRRQELQ
jgi:hypothetical protein